MADNETATLPEVEVKSVRNATISVDKAEGVVEAFAAAVGNKDSVGDIITPGAFAKSLNRRKPRVVWGHNWNEPIGKVLEITEVSPSDSRLPAKMKQAGVGGLFVKVQFNLASERGREAFASVMFFGEDQEWSIGYKTIESEYDPVRGAKLLREVELYEVSPVLHGANNLTGTISVKNENQAVATSEDERFEFSYGPTGDSENFSFGLSGEKGYDSDMDDDEADDRRMVRTAFQTALGNVENMKFVDDNRVVFDRPGDGMWMSDFRRQGRRIEMTRPVRARSQLTYMPVEVTPILPKPEMGPMEDQPHMPQMGSCPKCGYSGPGLHREKEDEKRAFSDESRADLAQVGNAMADGSYPISSVQDLKNAIQAIGRAKDPKAVKRHIASRARALNVPELIPDSWIGYASVDNGGKDKDGAPDDIETKVGRVISNANMGKLRQANALLNEVVSSGLPPAPPSMEEEAEEKKTLSGKIAHLKMKSESTVGFISSIADSAAKYGWDSLVDPDGKVDIYFATDDNMADQVKELAAHIEKLDDEVGISVEKKDASEVFQAK